MADFPDLILNGLPIQFDDEHFMRAALRCAENAMAAGEVPVGAVAVRNGEIIAVSQALGPARQNDCATLMSEIVIFAVQVESVADNVHVSLVRRVITRPLGTCSVHRLLIVGYVLNVLAPPHIFVPLAQRVIVNYIRRHKIRHYPH